MRLLCEKESREKGETRHCGEDGGGSRGEGIRDPSLDMPPVNVHPGLELLGGNEEVKVIRRNREDEGGSMPDDDRSEEQYKSRPRGAS